MTTARRWRLDKKLTAMMVEDFLFNPVLAAKVLLDVKLPPHEELRIMWMWSTFYTSDDSGFSTGKSWTFALIAALRSCLMPGRVSGILSKTFAQGKLIFTNFDRWYNSNAIFRSCIKHLKGTPRLVHGTDGWIAHFRGGSECRVLPPAFLQDAERIRSERWNDAYFDEWTTYGNFRAFNTTIMGRVTKENYFSDCPVRQNHVHLGSTPSFTHYPAYKLVRKVDHQIAVGNKDYGRFTCNYRHVPDTRKWKFLVSRKVIYDMQTSLPHGIIKSEIDGLWQKDSASYYNSFIVDRARLNNVPLITSRTTQNEIFIAGFDVAPGGGDSRESGQGDDFAMSVWRMVVPEYIPHHVLTIRKNKISDIAMSGLVHKYHRRFGFTLVVFDPGGGGLFVKDKLRNEKQLIDNEEVLCTPLTTVTDTSGVMGSPILISFARKDYYISQMWGKMASDSVIVNRAHKEFKGAIENKKLWLSGSWNGWEGNESTWDVHRKREWLNRNIELQEDQKLKAEMDLAVSQLVLVDYAKDKEGNATLDSYGMLLFKSKQKKDAAYSLLYGYIGVVVYKWLQDSGQELDSHGDAEEMTCSMEEI